MPWQPQFIIQSVNVKHLRANEKVQSFSFYLPEDALHEIWIKLAPYTLFTSASALVIYVSKLPLGACLIRACSISKLRKWIRC